METLSSLASILSRKKEFGEAEEVLKRALVISKKGNGEADQNILTELEGVYQSEQNWAEAEQICQGQIAKAETESGVENLDVAFPLYRLGCLYRDQKRLDEAEKCFRRVVAIEDKSYGMDSSKSQPGLSGLASILEDQKKFEEAIPIYQRLARIHENTNEQFADAMPGFKKDYTLLVFDIEGLGNCYMGAGRYAQAEEAYKRALDLNQRDLGPDAPVVGEGWFKLGKLYDAVGDNRSADAHYKRALSLLRKYRNSDGSEFKACLESYAKFLRKTNRNRDAESLEAELVSGAK